MHKYFSTGQYKNTIKKVHDRCNTLKIDVPTLQFKGTVKLHGTNASIYNVLEEDNIVIQSKNNEINLEEDNHGFARFVDTNKDCFNKIISVIKKNYPQEIPGQAVVVYGEWVGGNIQPTKALGVSQLPKMFVVFAIKFIKNNQNISMENQIDENSEEALKIEKWLKEEQITNILNQVDNLKEHKIYNIYDFPTFNVTIDMNNPKLTQNILIDITNNVEKECPVAKSLGVTGIGEGVVWKCVSNIPQIETSDLVFKVKGKEHSVTNVTTIAEVDTVKVQSINDFVDLVLTENRLQQGLDYLQEQQLPFLIKNISPFLKWMTADCLKEEADVIVASGLTPKDVEPVITNRSKQWFLTQLKNVSTNEQQNPKIKM
jgi:hypothetical protein